MKRQSGSKINNLLRNWPAGTVAVTATFERQGIDRKLVHVYKRSGWIDALGHSAYQKAGDIVDWTGGVYALQRELGLPLHVGGTTALNLQGYAQFLPTGEDYPVTLYGESGVKLPTWFQEHDWMVTVIYSTSNLFDNARHEAMIAYQRTTYSIEVSAPERAILEVLNSVRDAATLAHARDLFEGLLTLRPYMVMQLLQNCRSVKVKRLFLVLAEEFQHPWLVQVDLTSIDFGRGKRVLVPGGKFNPKYQITIPGPADRGPDV